MVPVARGWRRVAVVLVAGMYVLGSCYAVFLLWMQGFCDTAESNCALPWTASRTVLWAGWFAMGLLIVPSAGAALRPAAARGAAFVGAAVVVMSLVVALWIRGDVGR